MKSFLQRYEKLIKKRDKANKKLRELRKEAQKTFCSHDSVTNYLQDMDDGYGKWWKVNMTRCNICGKNISFGEGQE